MRMNVIEWHPTQQKNKRKTAKMAESWLLKHPKTAKMADFLLLNTTVQGLYPTVKKQV